LFVFNYKHCSNLSIAVGLTIGVFTCFLFIVLDSLFQTVCCGMLS